jgi:hypothetical protein
MTNQPQSNPAITSKPKKTNLLAILILIVILLGAIIIAGYYYFIPEDRANKNTNQAAVNTNANTNAAADETAGWQTYTNSTYNYLIEYPDDYSLEGSGQLVTFKKVFLVETDGYLNSTHYVSVRVLDSNAQNYYKTVYDWAMAGFIEKDNPSGYSFKDMETLGNNNYRVYSVASGMDTVTEYFIIKNNKVYSLYNSCLGNCDIFKGAEISATFQFTDETADWQTYTNTVYSYQTKYPTTYKVDDHSNENKAWISPIEESIVPVFKIFVTDKKIEAYEKDLRDEHIDPKPEENLNYVMNDGTPYFEEVATIGGIKGKKLGFGTAIGLNDIYYIVEYKGITYSISTIEANNFAIFETMVKTFEFTD